MQKNWYIIYTKPKSEKKVSLLLSKKKIENFLPLNLKEITSLRKKKACQEPLFKSYVFAYTDEGELEKIREINGVLNVLYWKGQPAVIKREEIQLMKDFLADYHEVKVERTMVNAKNFARVTDGSKYSISGNVLSIKNTMVRVNLPSLGYSLFASVGTRHPLLSERAFANNNLLIES
ncbi:MAG TPA: transcription termination/antitermination NusG family protein [Hanamia sp.]|nr:transcription termination/antitermination NusG family protein [Hanamia sp.]